MQTFDYLVIGGGSGGLASAQRAAEYGARVALFEPGRLGGTCVNVGCVPKKVMWYAAEVKHALDNAPYYGFDVRAAGHDWALLKRSRDAYVERLNGIYQRNLDRKSIVTVRSAARFTKPGELVTADGTRYVAAHVLVATGGHPIVPKVPGAELGITSDGFFDLDRLPARVAIVGGGYVAVEFAGVFRALGADVSVFVRSDRVLRYFDSVLSHELMRQMTAQGIEIVTSATPAAVESDSTLALATTDGRRFPGFDTLIWAIGRAPNTAQLGLDTVGVETDRAGFVLVDEYQNSNVPGIYSVGDVTGQAELTPVAIAAGRRLADRLFGGQSDRRLSYDLIPTVVFSHPPIGSVGLSEAATHARHAGEAIKVYHAEFVPMLYALTEHKPRTAMKLVTVGEDERVVGCHVIGPGADEMIQGFAVAIGMGARKRDFDDTIAIHPTSAEELVTMR